MQELKTSIPSDTWVTASWDDYIQIVSNPIYDKAKCYYHNEQLRIEMSPVGHDHSSDNTIIGFAINLYAVVNNIPLKGLTNCSFRQQGVQECQPDLSYYLREKAQVVPYGTKIISLNQYPPPDLAIEIGDTSLTDDLNRKKILYEQLSVSEYWVVDVTKTKILTFVITDEKSQSITESQVLPGLKINVLEEALQRSRITDQTQVCAWLLEQFQIK
jgi:Uma2 family endonuclease